MSNPSLTADLIRERLAALSPDSCSLIDESHKHAGHAGARQGGHYRLVIASAQFEGLSRVARHRLVFSLLDTLMRDGIHALSITALTPQEALALIAEHPGAAPVQP